MIYLDNENGVDSVEVPYAKKSKTADRFRELLGLAPDDLLSLTGSGAEAITEVFYSQYLDHIHQTGKTHFIATTCAEATVQLLLKRFQKLGCTYTLIEPNEKGQITAEMIEREINPRTGMVSMSWANPLTGVVHPIWEVAEKISQKGVYFHVDATPILGKLFFRFGDMPIDFLTVDGARCGAPRAGALAIRKGSEWTPLIPKAYPNVIPVLNEAAEQLFLDFDFLCTETATLRDLLEQGVEGTILYPNTERLPNVTALYFEGVSQELLLFHLVQQGIYATYGGGQFPRLPLGVLSFALSRHTKREEVEKAIDVINATYRRIKW
ncbi:MAG: aminotransferase class V-fold PLP-dependent enzyme [Simkaniaceae bacterium]|nr:aminotransferase class V-fold PLP-dependent enzyme [Simkaniaceae bacterium]